MFLISHLVIPSLMICPSIVLRTLPPILLSYFIYLGTYLSIP